MKKILLLAAMTAVCGGVSAQKNPNDLQKSSMQPAVALKNGLDSASYAYGVLLGTQLKQMIGEEYNAPLVLAALNATMSGAEKPAIPAESAQAIYQAYNQQIQAKAAEKTKAEGSANKMAGEKFLAENKKRKEVTTTASGLQYEVLKKGSGTVKPTATDKVKVHYHGTNIDGSVFDSSVERGEPISFGLNQVIKGWTEGVQLMSPGDKFKFYIPSELAYGDRSPSPKIKAGSTLVFEVELFEINPK